MHNEKRMGKEGLNSTEGWRRQKMERRGQRRGRDQTRGGKDKGKAERVGMKN